jgi:uncharacterized protein YxeA
MRILLLVMTVMFAANKLCAQKLYTGKKPSVKFTDLSGAKLKEEDADLMIAVTKIGDTSYRLDEYKANGPLRRSQYFKTASLDQPHGLTVTYHKNGWVQSFGTYLEGNKEGEWRLVNDTGRTYKLEIYERGKLVSSEDIPEHTEEEIEAFKNGAESEFPGGTQGWTNYLQQNLVYPKKALKAEIRGKVCIFFMVNDDGSVQNPFLYKSLHYLLDMEGVRLIELSPKWVPAVRENQPVRSFKVQPIIFHFTYE